MPKVSVLMPTHNRPQLVGRSIETVLSQEVDLELLILDNGSLPDVAEVLDRYQDPRIRRFRREDNTRRYYEPLIAEAKGDYIVRFTDDDLMLPGTLKWKADILDALPKVGFVFSSAGTIDADGYLTGERCLGRAHECHVESGAAAHLIATNFICMPTVMYRAGIPTQEYNSAYGDWMLWLSMSQVCDSAYIDMDTVAFRFHENSDSSTRGIRDRQFLTEPFVVWKQWLDDGHMITDEEWGVMTTTYLQNVMAVVKDDHAELAKYVNMFMTFKEQYVDHNRP